MMIGMVTRFWRRLWAALQAEWQRTAPTPEQLQESAHVYDTEDIW